jgi:hypothetical protein
VARPCVFGSARVVDEDDVAGAHLLGAVANDQLRVVDDGDALALEHHRERGAHERIVRDHGDGGHRREDAENRAEDTHPIG